MKTTINLDDDLLAAVRSRAAEQQTTMRGVIEEALRRLLTQPDAGRFTLELPVTRGRRSPTLDVDSNTALEEYLDRSEQEAAGA
jgi:Arc/MetJ family transcription regulator